MKIAFVVHEYNRVHGHSRYVAELATRFAPDHEVHVFANRFDPAVEQGIIFHKIPALRLNVVTTVLSFALSSRLMLRGGFDIVHSQGYCGPRSNVITAHICNAAWSRALSRVARQSVRERIFHALASRLEDRLYRGAAKGGAHVIAISERVLRDLEDDYGCRAPAHLIYHGVALDVFSPAARRFRAPLRQSLGLPESETVFLYVGDLRKGARQCMRALSRLPHGRLVCVSASPREPYQAFAEELQIGGRVHLLPSTRRIQEFYGAADAFVLPTPYDAFGLVVTEAMASGLPVIVSREAGASELIEQGRNGLVLEDPGDESELARHMSFLLSDPAAAAGMGQSARHTVERFSWDTAAQQTMRVFEELAASPSGPPRKRG